MAFTRKFLSALGIEEDKVEQIITAHTEVTDALKKERDDFREKADTVDDIQKELNKTKNKLKEYEDNDSGEDSWKSKYEKEKSAKEKAEQDLKDYKADVDAKETLATKKNAYRELLKEKKISDKRFEAIIKVTDFDKIELDKDGKIKNIDDVGKNIESEWSEFIVTKSEAGAGTATPPANNGGSGANGQSRAAKLAAQYHANLYGTPQNNKED